LTDEATVDLTNWLNHHALQPNAAESPAAGVMRRLNPNAVVGLENGCAVFVEDWWDCPTDKRLYRMEYRSTLDDRHAIALCLSNPWNRSDRTAGTSVHHSHVFADGLLCLSSHHAREPASSPFDLENVVARARYWCTAFSVLKETGSFPNP
jgi:hypothetical protein